MLSIMKTISEVLRAEIRRYGKAQYALAVEAGVDPAALFRFVCNERDIRLHTADKLCRALGLRLVRRRKGRA